MPSLSVAQPGAVHSPAAASPGPEDLWRIAAQRSEDGIYGVGRSGRIFGWTLGAARLFGYQDDQATELVGELLVSEHDRPLYRDLFSRVLEGETVERVALTAQRSDGMFVPVSVTPSLPLDGGDGDKLIPSLRWASKVLTPLDNLAVSSSAHRPAQRWDVCPRHRRRGVPR